MNEVLQNIDMSTLEVLISDQCVDVSSLSFCKPRGIVIFDILRPTLYDDSSKNNQCYIFQCVRPIIRTTIELSGILEVEIQTEAQGGLLFSLELDRSAKDVLIMRGSNGIIRMEHGPLIIMVGESHATNWKEVVTKVGLFYYERWKRISDITI